MSLKNLSCKYSRAFIQSNFSCVINAVFFRESIEIGKINELYNYQDRKSKKVYKKWVNTPMY